MPSHNYFNVLNVKFNYFQDVVQATTMSTQIQIVVNVNPVPEEHTMMRTMHNPVSTVQEEKLPSRKEVTTV